MLDAMVQLGLLLAQKSGQSATEALVKPMPSLQGKGERYVIDVNVDTMEGRLWFTPVKCEPADKDRLAKELLWIGNADGPNSPQWTATSQKLDYLLSQTIGNLRDMLPEDSEVRTALNRVQDVCMMDVGPQQGHENRYRYVFDLERVLGLPTVEWNQLLDGARTGPDGAIHAKSLIPPLSKAVLQHQKYSAGQVYLFTLSVDGKRIANSQDYKDLILRNKILTVYENGKAGRCSVCGMVGEVTSNLTRMKFKYYNTDKMSFASGVSRKRFDRNIVLCRSCYSACLAAEPFVMGQMASRIGHLQFYIVPQVFVETPEDLNPMRWTQFVSNEVQSAVNFEAIATLEDELAADRDEYENMSYAVNLLFYAWNNAELHLYNLVRDVPETRFQTLRAEFNRVEWIAKSVLGPRSKDGKQKWRPDFNAIYHLIPVNRSNQSAEYRRVLQVFDAILTAEPVSYRLLVESFCNLIEVRRFARYATTNVEKPSAGWELETLANDVLMANLVLFGLQDLGQLAGSPLSVPMKGRQSGVEATINSMNEKVNAKAFLETMGYGTGHQALFWLGAAIASVAREQQKNGFESMPVLEKINYRGMNAADVVRLTNQVEEAFRQYKLLKYPSSSDTLFQMHAAFGEAFDTSGGAASGSPRGSGPHWKSEHFVTDQEAVFYILSGFSVKRKEALSHSSKPAASAEESPESEPQHA